MRLFVAFLLDPDVRAHLERACTNLSRRCNGVRWIQPEQLHVTVQFLGEVRDADLPRITRALEQGAAEGAPFEMKIVGCGCFPPRGPVRIVWAGVTDESGTMNQVVMHMGTALRGVGFPPERRAWHGHVTLGRVREDRSGGALRESVTSYELAPAVQFVESVSLMASVLSPQGARYSQVRRVTLGSRDVSATECVG